MSLNQGFGSGYGLDPKSIRSVDQDRTSEQKSIKQTTNNHIKVPFFTYKKGVRIRIRIGTGFNQVRGSGSVFGIRIRIQEGKNDPQKYNKVQKFHVLTCWMFCFEG
jgi:hypothetical protein